MPLQLHHHHYVISIVHSIERSKTCLLTLALLCVARRASHYLYPNTDCTVP